MLANYSGLRRGSSENGARLFKPAIQRTRVANCEEARTLFFRTFVSQLGACERGETTTTDGTLPVSNMGDHSHGGFVT